MTLQEIKIIEDDVKSVIGKSFWSKLNFPIDRLEYEHFLRQLAWSIPAITQRTKNILTQF